MIIISKIRMREVCKKSVQRYNRADIQPRNISKYKH